MVRLFNRTARRLPRAVREFTGFERLEDRAMLAAGPAVTGVELGSTQWSTAFVGYLQSHGLGQHGYEMPTGANQAKTLPWNNLNKVVISFNKDVDIQSSDFSVSGINTAAISFTDFFYDAFNHVASWTLSQPLGANVYQIDLDGDGVNPVRDLSGNALDGEWTNNSSAFASGNGTAGGDFQFVVKVLPGDVNQSNYVENFDYYASNARQGLTTSSSNYSALADINGNGVDDAPDKQAILAALWGTDPTGAPIGATSDAPSVAEIGTIQVNDYVNDVAISLFDAFEDHDEVDEWLAFEVEDVSNPDLFDYVTLNTETGELSLNAAWSASGRSTITVAATDSTGLRTSTTFSVDVNYQNQAPDIYFIPDNQGNNQWVIAGQVTDVDDDVRGMIVSFTGAFTARATVQENGWFSFAVSIDPAHWGDAQASVTDAHPNGWASYTRHVSLT